MSKRKKEMKLDELIEQFKKNDAEAQIQFEQLLAGLVICQIRAEFLAKMYLSKEKYDIFTKNVDFFITKYCTNQKKDVTLQPETVEDRFSHKGDVTLPYGSKVNVKH